MDTSSYNAKPIYKQSQLLQKQEPIQTQEQEQEQEGPFRKTKSIYYNTYDTLSNTASMIANTPKTLASTIRSVSDNVQSTKNMIQSTKQVIDQNTNIFKTNSNEEQKQSAFVVTPEEIQKQQRNRKRKRKRKPNKPKLSITKVPIQIYNTTKSIQSSIQQTSNTLQSTQRKVSNIAQTTKQVFDTASWVVGVSSKTVYGVADVIYEWNTNSTLEDSIEGKKDEVKRGIGERVSLLSFKKDASASGKKLTIKDGDDSNSGTTNEKDNKKPFFAQLFTNTKQTNTDTVQITNKFESTKEDNTTLETPKKKEVIQTESTKDDAQEPPTKKDLLQPKSNSETVRTKKVESTKDVTPEPPKKKEIQTKSMPKKKDLFFAIQNEEKPKISKEEIRNTTKRSINKEIDELRQKMLRLQEKNDNSSKETNDLLDRLKDFEE